MAEQSRHSSTNPVSVFQYRIRNPYKPEPERHYRSYHPEATTRLAVLFSPSLILTLLASYIKMR